MVDNGVFTYKHGNLLYIVALYVDDSILVGRKGKFIKNFEAALSQKFEIEDLSLAYCLLGCRIDRDRGKRILRLGKEQYVTDILEYFNMSSSAIVGTPMAARLSLEADSDQPFDTQAYMFPSLIGKLLYCSNCTCPDIITIVNHLSIYMATPTISHWAQAKRILRYLNGTKSLCLAFNGSISLYPIMWQTPHLAMATSGDQGRASSP